MSAPAAISGEFATIKHVPSRKVYQLVIEVAEEAAQHAFDTLGMPGHGGHIALARLVEDARVKPEHVKERTPFTDLPLSQQAALRCAEPYFYRFLTTKFRPDAIVPFDPKLDQNTPPSVPMLRHHLGIGSRRDLDLFEEKAKAWLALDAEYYAWQRGRR